MSDLIRIKKGLDINLEGKAERNLSETKTSVFYAVKPTDFPGLTPKVIAKPGDEVKAGTPLFYDKYKPNVLFTSPVSGKISAINRGERRKILEFVVEADGKNQSEAFVKSNPNELSREVIKENLLKSGCWPYILQRPFAIIANPNDIPRDIFVTTFNSAPLAPDFDFVVKDDFENFQTGINALRKLTDGKIYLGIKAGQISSLYKTTANAEKVEFSGPHPVGNVGTQINKIKPVNKGEIVWTLNATEVIIIGRLFNKGIYDPTRIVAITGSEVIRPAYHKAISGIQIEKLVENNIKTTDGEIRYISGNVLTGEKVSPKNFLGFYDSQLTIIPEGNEPEFLGWGAPGFGKFSISRTFFSWLNKNKELKINTNLRGGKRPFIVTGEFEKVFPLDILPMQLLKAIHVKDLDLMEELGIYEVAEEDFALCEVINTSKIEIQKLVREGFEFMIKELG
jgi:Na+-transporting NADH:ubiquinone oxidoreductase subunit A